MSFGATKFSGVFGSREKMRCLHPISKDSTTVVRGDSVPEFWCPDVAGLRQIIRDYSCNGIYLDEIAYDRVTMLRARKVLGNEGSE